MSKVKDIVTFLLNKYPLSLCDDIDKGKVGLQFGSLEQNITKILIALDGTNQVIDEAIENNCEMIITHHPFVFNPILNLDYDTGFSKKLLKVFNNKLNMFSMHTNFDAGNDGMNDILSNIIGMKNVHTTINNNYLRIGEIDEMSLYEFAEALYKTFDKTSVRICGNPNKKIKKVGIIAGGGRSFTHQAINEKIDCFISGEFHHNNGIQALEEDLCLIELSHYIESNFKSFVYNLLTENFPDIEFIISTNEEDPFKTISNI
mgnify:CR=1 FL=1